MKQSNYKYNFKIISNNDVINHALNPERFIDIVKHLVNIVKEQELLVGKPAYVLI